MSDRIDQIEYSDKDLTSVHINLPTSLWDAVEGIARFLSTTKTNIVVRSLDNYAYFMRVLKDDPQAAVILEHGDGTREHITFPELKRKPQAAIAATPAVMRSAKR